MMVLGMRNRSFRAQCLRCCGLALFGRSREPFAAVAGCAGLCQWGCHTALHSQLSPKPRHGPTSAGLFLWGSCRPGSWPIRTDISRSRGLPCSAPTAQQCPQKIASRVETARHAIRLLFPSRSPLQPMRPLPGQTARGRLSIPILGERARFHTAGQMARPKSRSSCDLLGPRLVPGIYELALRALSTNNYVAFIARRNLKIKHQQQHSEIIAARHRGCE
jgi:hypothetical protein